ncbi:hypothetical protein FRC09_015958 [Ceratobasidium sp. 395]|nr:hypothetical protein FRC09_015958 [Ceratobasidium sp. 395]
MPASSRCLPSVNYHAKDLDIATAAYVHIQSAEMHNQAVNSLALITARATIQALDVFSPLTASYRYLPPPKVAPVAIAQPDFVLGVIGSKACGKSTLIKLAIDTPDVKQSRLVAVSADGPTMTLASTTFSRGAVRTLEINADELLDLSTIDSENGGFGPMSPKIGTSFTDPSFITILLACKFDSLDESSPDVALEAPAERAAKLGAQYGIQFVWAIHRMPRDVSQMLHTFQWMLDHLTKYRGRKTTTASDAPLPTKSALARTRSAGDLVSTWMSDSPDAGPRSTPTSAPPVFHPPPPPPEEAPCRKSTGEESLPSLAFR